MLRFISSVNIAFVALSVCLASCGPSKPGVTKTAEAAPQVETVEAAPMAQLGGKRAMPFAYIYKTNGDYNDNVTASYDATTGRFVSFPAPTDVAPGNEPMKLIDGWLLDSRGGVSDNTVFLKWTYQQYHDLASTPSLTELKEAILPDARVTEVVRLNMTSFAAQGDTALVNRMIRDMNH